MHEPPSEKASARGGKTPMIHDNVFILISALTAIILAAVIFVVLNSGKSAAEYAAVQARALRFRSRRFRALLAAGGAPSVIRRVPGRERQPT